MRPTGLALRRARAPPPPAQASLDIERVGNRVHAKRKAGEQSQQCHEYMTWGGNRGVHRYGLARPPSDLCVGVFRALQVMLDAYSLLVRARLHPGRWTWSVQKQATWTRVVLPRLQPGGQHFQLLNHPFLGTTLSAGERDDPAMSEAWVLRRLSALERTGGIVLDTVTAAATTASSKAAAGSDGGGRSKGKRKKMDQPRCPEESMRKLQASNLSPATKAGFAAQAQRHRMAVQLAHRQGFQKGHSAGAAARVFEPGSAAAAHHRVLMRKGTGVTQGSLLRVRQMDTLQPCAQMAAAERQLSAAAEEPARAAVPRPTDYRAVHRLLEPHAALFAPALDDLYPRMTDHTRTSELQVGVFENGSSESSASAASAGVFVVPIAGPLPRERDGSPWPKTWRELAMSEDRAPERLFELVFKLVCRRVPGGAAPVLPPGYAASLSSVVRTFVNAQVLTHGQGQFAARTAQPRARRRRCQPQPQPAASAVPGRKPKPLQVLVRSQDVDRPGDIKSCIIGEFYMPELRRSKPPLQLRDLRYEAIFEDQAQPAFGPSALRLRLGASKFRVLSRPSASGWLAWRCSQSLYRLRNTIVASPQAYSGPSATRMSAKRSSETSTRTAPTSTHCQVRAFYKGSPRDALPRRSESVCKLT